MKTTCSILLAAAMIALAANAPAQTSDGAASATPQVTAPLPASPQSSAPPAVVPPPSALQAPIGEIIFGARINSTPTMGRFMRFDDLRSGPTIERLRYAKDRDTWAFNANVFDVGYRDQRYSAAFEQYGKVKASFDYNQIPIWYGDVEQTPYREESPGVFRLNDTIQAAVQNGQATTAAYAPELQSLDLRSRRDILNGRVMYAPTRHIDLSVTMTSTHRTGAQPWAAPFGFSNSDQVPVPLDRRNNDVTTAAEWSNQQGMVRLAWDGSWFTNNVESLIWDNPLRYTDTYAANAYSTGAASSQGRMALWPDSTAQTVSASGSVKLPARSRAFAYVSVGEWDQNQQLLPFTINTSVPPIPMPRETAEAKARVTSMNYRYTSRPTDRTWFTAQYRLYDFDNQSEPFPLDRVVLFDGTPEASPSPETEPFGYKRQFADVDASYNVARFVAFRAGYGVEHDNRTYRYFERTTDQTVRASLDSTQLSWGSLRVQYDRSVRTGSGLDEQVLDDIGEQISLRQFDIANRTRDRVMGILQYLPTQSLGFNVTGSVARERRPDSAFGLQDNDVDSVTVGFDYTPTDAISAGASYGFDNYGTLQRSRQALPPPDPQFTDPRRDWSTDMDENVHTVSLYLDLPHIVQKTAVHVAYDSVHDGARYLYELAPNSTLATPNQLPVVRSHFHLFTADARYDFAKQLGLGFGYRLDYFETNDFALTPGVIDSPFMPTFFNLMYQWRPYNVHTGYIRLIYHW